MHSVEYIQHWLPDDGVQIAVGVEGSPHWSCVAVGRCRVGEVRESHPGLRARISNQTGTTGARCDELPRRPLAHLPHENTAPVRDTATLNPPPADTEAMGPSAYLRIAASEHACVKPEADVRTYNNVQAAVVKNFFRQVLTLRR